MDLGGKKDPRFGGTPIRLTGTVGAVSDGIYVRKGKYMTGTTANMGPSFRLDLDGMQIIVATHATQIDDREQFRIYGIEPERMNILACKAMNHFRVDFEPIARGLSMSMRAAFVRLISSSFLGASSGGRSGRWT